MGGTATPTHTRRIRSSRNFAKTATKPVPGGTPFKAVGEGKREGIREKAVRAGVAGHEQEGSEDEGSGDASGVADEVVQECHGLELQDGHAATRKREATSQTTVLELEARC